MIFLHILPSYQWLYCSMSVSGIFCWCGLTLIKEKSSHSQSVPWEKSIFPTLKEANVGHEVKSGCWFQICCMFTPILGEVIQFEEHIFFRWVGEEPPTRNSRDLWRWKDCWLASFLTCRSRSWTKKTVGMRGKRRSNFLNFLIGHLGGGFKHFLFSPLFGEDSHFD